MDFTFKELKAIIELVSKSNIDEFSFKNADFELYLKKEKEKIIEKVTIQETPAVSESNSPSSSAEQISKKEEKITKESKSDYIPIKSPIVGTFYRAPNPGAKPFVEIGSEVNEDTTVCIVEAMKVFNEIKANCKGIVAEILVEDAQPVEYDQVLMYVKPY